MPFKPFERIGAGFKQIGSNINQSVKGLGKIGNRLPRAVLGNIQDVLIRPAFSVAASAAVNPAAAVVAAPLAAALGAVDLTISGADKVFDVAGLPKRRKIEKGEFIKQSSSGQALEQFLFGEVKGLSIPDELKNKIKEEAATKEGKQYITETLREYGVTDQELSYIKQITS